MDFPLYFLSVSGNDIGDGPAIQFAAVPQLLDENSVDNETLHNDFTQLLNDTSVGTELLHNDLVALHNDFNILIGTLLLIVTMYFVMTIRSKLFSRRKK